jgi:hypothetical protein
VKKSRCLLPFGPAFLSSRLLSDILCV